MNFTDEELENEEWRQSMEADYVEVSSLGRIRSKTRFVPMKNNSIAMKKGKVLKLVKDQDGYFTFSLYVDKKRHKARVHRIVVNAFYPDNPNKLPSVNHIDANRENNRILNLERCTPDQNSKHMCLLNNQTKGENQHLSKLTADDVRQIRGMFASRTNKEIAADLGVNGGTIWFIRKGITWKHVD